MFFPLFQGILQQFLYFRLLFHVNRTIMKIPAKRVANHHTLSWNRPNTLRLPTPTSPPIKRARHLPHPRPNRRLLLRHNHHLKSNLQSIHNILIFALRIR